MPSTTCHLPNGQTFSVAPVFDGFTFKSNEMNLHHSAFPPGWMIVIHTEKVSEEDSERVETSDSQHDSDAHHASGSRPRESAFGRFKKPTPCNDYLFISSISNPPSSDFKPPSSPTRQIAMLLWASLWWYFHELEPNLHVTTEASSETPEAGRPRGDWRVKIKREGIFKGRNLLPKLERMGLIASEDSCVGLDSAESSRGFTGMFASRRSFWQLDPRIFLFTLSPASNPPTHPPSPSLSPHPSPPPTPRIAEGLPGDVLLLSPAGGPFSSRSHLPTYFPPAPSQYTFTDGIRHPIRQKPPHPGETFYTRYIPSVNQYLSFRVPMLLPPKMPGHNHTATVSSISSLSVPIPSNQQQQQQAHIPSDLEFLHKWMNDPRVNASWSEAGPRSRQEQFLRDGLTNRHSFPVIGCWDGKPFGYFEIYWVKEDRLGRLLAGHVDDYDRGLHALVGEQEFRGPHRVSIWLSALVHYCWLADPRTRTVVLEPRVDNAKFINYLQDAGFYKEGEVSFPHKQSAVMKIKRDYWEAPAL
ncbi:Acyl-CoA N-acyltransferase [Elaphomyces granulatus]